MREQAFQIAEAGIEYYRWHLAHASTDYQDGAGAPGPYVHEYRDATGAVIGTFTLTITPPPVGSTLEAKFAIPSIAKFAFVANSKMRFGAGTEVFGPIHSNDGIRFDGLAHNLVTSFKYSYDDPDHSGADEYGVHTHLSPSDPVPPVPPPPGTPPSRTDVFISGRQVSVPAVDWNGFTQDLSQMKTDAQTSGRYFAGSGALGYNIVLKTDDTFDLYTVTSLVSPQSNCYNSQNQSGWGTWSIASETLLGNYAFPANGLVFLEDNVWVEGTISSARLTIAAGRFPESSSTNANIIVNEDIRYTNYDGADVLGLIAQGNINVGLVSNDVLTIDAAIVAKNGRAGRYYYRYAFSKSCSPYHQRDTINLFGMIATKERYGFAYTDGNGYETRNIIYDGNLLYGPPPSFPLTSDQYQTISWREL
ncbi:MAG: hypothetical protein UY88_C0009G0009 [Parcubacteria group bacterium GW2011_GWA1_54_88]|nr:MAG: hypothetical protein UY88_C0009G0009 [Parcubacteria group bacterium GW2011_GWA1_54_88]